MKTQLASYPKTITKSKENFRRVRKVLSFALPLCALMYTHGAKAQTITTFAGTGTHGNTGNGGPATSADIANHFAVAVDGSGNVYFASADYSVVRYIDAGGTIHLFAGNGTAGFSGDGGQATAAQLALAMGVAVDGSGNVYIADGGNNRIRKVDPSGIITTIAGTGVAGYSGDGGAATLATMNNPLSIAVDGSGNIYFAENGNHIIRMVDASGTISTLAGNGTGGYSGDGGPATLAQLSGPTGVAYDAATGNVYIADQGNARVRYVNSGSIWTYAGTGISGYTGDCGAAFNAELQVPFGVATDAEGNLFIADMGSHVVREVYRLTETIVTYAGNGTNGYTGDNGPATAAELSAPVAIAVDASRNVYISDLGEFAIRQVNYVPGTAPNLPSTSDNSWYTSANPIRGENTASIAYAPIVSPNTIIASDYYDGTTNSTIHAYDPAVGNATIATTTKGGVPDVIIGNTRGGAGTICPTCTPGRNYILADAYINNTGRVEVDFFKITDNGLSISLATLGSSHTFAGYQPRNVHIDVISDPNNTGTTGFPFCNKYVVTWDDFSTATPNIFAAYGDLNTGSITPAVQVNPTGIGGVHGYAPDVAAIKRTVGLSTDDVALITYVDMGGNALYYQEYDFTASTASAVTTLDNGSTSTAIDIPRIDAFDDPTINSLAGVSKYKVAAQVTNCGAIEVRTYDNLLGAGSHFTSSSVVDVSGLGAYSQYIPPYINRNPSVAVGANSGNDYDVAHFSIIYPQKDVLLMEPIDRGTPTSITTSGYFWVNSSSGTPTDTHQMCVNSVSTPANDISLNSFYAWSFYNGANYEVDYKLSAYPYAFRHEPAQATGVTEHEWSIYPNPATDELVINNATGNSVTSYRIMDMAGRLVSQGAVSGSRQTVNVSKLAKGNYIIGMFKDEVSDGNTVFVKN